MQRIDFEIITRCQYEEFSENNVYNRPLTVSSWLICKLCLCFCRCVPLKYQFRSNSPQIAFRLLFRVSTIFLIRFARSIGVLLLFFLKVVAAVSFARLLAFFTCSSNIRLLLLTWVWFFLPSESDSLNSRQPTVVSACSHCAAVSRPILTEEFEVWPTVGNGHVLRRFLKNISRNPILACISAWHDFWPLESEILIRAQGQKNR